MVSRILVMFLVARIVFLGIAVVCSSLVSELQVSGAR